MLDRIKPLVRRGRKMIYFILQYFIPSEIEDITELMSLDTYMLAPIFMIIVSVSLIMWMLGNHNKDKGDK